MTWLVDDLVGERIAVAVGAGWGRVTRGVLLGCQGDVDADWSVVRNGRCQAEVLGLVGIEQDGRGPREVGTTVPLVGEASLMGLDEQLVARVRR